MSKKDAALIGLGVAIGAFAMMASWWIVAAMPDTNTLEVCQSIETWILEDYNTLLDKEGVESIELETESLMSRIDTWLTVRCNLNIPESAPTINEILKSVWNEE